MIWNMQEVKDFDFKNRKERIKVGSTMQMYKDIAEDDELVDVIILKHGGAFYKSEIKTMDGTIKTVMNSDLFDKK